MPSIKYDTFCNQYHLILISFHSATMKDVSVRGKQNWFIHIKRSGELYTISNFVAFEKALAFCQAATKS